MTNHHLTYFPILIYQSSYGLLYWSYRPIIFSLISLLLLTNHLLGCLTVHWPIISLLAWPRIDQSSLGNSNCYLSVCSKLFHVISYSQTSLNNSELSSLSSVTPTINKTSIQCSNCLTLLAVLELPVGSMYAADGFYDKSGKSWVPTHL